MKTYQLISLIISCISSSTFGQKNLPSVDQQAAVPGNSLQDIVFRYDEAGNQIYRGTSVVANPEKIQNIIEETKIAEEDIFWKGVQIYPVPVKDVLTISWNEENDRLIESVSLYQHNSIAFLFEQKNYPNLARQVKVNMGAYYMGVYVVSFQLSDGKILTRNIIKE